MFVSVGPMFMYEQADLDSSSMFASVHVSLVT